MRGPSLSDWLDRPGYVAVLAFLAGAAVAAIVAVFILTRDGDDAGGPQVVATSTVRRTPLLTALPGQTATRPPARTPTATPGAAATATPAGARDADDALANFVRTEMAENYIGPCPQELAPGEPPPSGVCSLELYRSEELVTFTLGYPFSEGVGEAVLARREDGSWSVDFIPLPPLGEGGIAVGAEAVVFGAGSCLNFRAEPSTSAEVLSCQLDGTRGQVTEGPVAADEITWWRLEGLGWASGEFLLPAD